MMLFPWEIDRVTIVIEWHWDVPSWFHGVDLLIFRIFAGYPGGCPAMFVAVTPWIL